MTDDDRKPGAAWDLLEDLLAEDEIERRMAMPAEERRAAMKAQGLDPDAAHTLANEVLAKLGHATSPVAAPTAPAPAPAPAPVVNLAAERAKRRAPRPTWLLLVAAAALVVTVGGGGAVVAVNWPSPSATTSVPQVPTAPPGPSPEELAQKRRSEAEELRKVAAADCAAQRWGPCVQKLNDARMLDPQGDETRAVRRLNDKAVRELGQKDREVKLGDADRSIPSFEQAAFVKALAASKGQAIRVVCARDREPSALCNQLVAALTRAGWAVTRINATPDAGPLPHGMLIEVATDADEATQAATDVLAAALENALLFARGPNDAAPGGDAPLRLTVGPP